MLNSFRSPLFALSLLFPPRLCLWRNVLGAFSRDPFAITRRASNVRFKSAEKLFNRSIEFRKYESRGKYKSLNLVASTCKKKKEKEKKGRKEKGK